MHQTLVSVWNGPRRFRHTVRELHEMLRITLTGEVTVASASRVLGERNLGGRRARLMLAMLVVERPRPVPVAELAEVLWAHEAPRSWQASLREVASKVRTCLETVGLHGLQVLGAAFGCYQLRLPEDAEVDIEWAQSALHAAERHLAEGRAGEAVDVAADAAAVLRRPLLVGEQSPWVEDERARLRTHLVRALETVAAARLARDQPASAVAAAREVVALEPFREGAWITLMRAQASSGHQPEALRTYESWRRLLADELGVDPCAEAQRLYHSLLDSRSGASTLPARVLRTAQRGGRGLPGALGARWRTPFVGRQNEVQQLAGWVAAGTAAGGLVMVSGEAGIGKTRLCAEVAAAFGGMVLYGRCDPDPLVPLEPFAQVVDGWIAAAPADVRTAVLEVHGPALGRLLPALSQQGEAYGTDVTTFERYRLLEALVAVLTAAAPALVVVDDLHCADLGSLSMFVRVVRRLGDAGAVVVASFRSDEPAPRLLPTLAALRREEAVNRLRLGGLDEVAVAELAAAADGEPVSADSAAQLRVYTGGNPFYLVELLRSGPLRTAARDIAAPPGVREVVGDRLARLSPATRSLLVAAAVAGGELACDAAARGDGGVWCSAIHEARAYGLITPLGGGNRYRFVHEIVRVALHEEFQCLQPAIDGGLCPRWSGGRKCRGRGRSGQADGYGRSRRDCEGDQAAHGAWQPGSWADDDWRGTTSATSVLEDKGDDDRRQRYAEDP